MAYANLAKRAVIVSGLFLGLALVVGCIEMLDLIGDLGGPSLDLGDPATVMRIHEEAVPAESLEGADRDCIIRTSSGQPYTGWARETDRVLTYYEDGRLTRQLIHSTDSDEVNGVRSMQKRFSWNGNKVEGYWEWYDGEERSELDEEAGVGICVDGNLRRD